MTAKKVLTKIGDSVSIYLYDNGFMVEASGKDADGNWKTSKVVCNTSAELLDLIKLYISLERDE